MSRTINCILDDVGYKEERIREQIQTVTKIQRACRIWGIKAQLKFQGTQWCEVNTVGSQIEGSMLYDSSDWDTLCVCNKEKGYESVDQCLTKDEDCFIVETYKLPPGYCALRHYHPSEAGNQSTVHIYASSSLTMKNMEKNSGASRKGHFISFSFNNRQGPSLPANVTNSKGELKYPIDFVCAVLCHCPSLLHKWRYRRRPQNWQPFRIQTIDTCFSLYW